MIGQCGSCTWSLKREHQDAISLKVQGPKMCCGETHPFASSDRLRAIGGVEILCHFWAPMTARWSVDSGQQATDFQLTTTQQVISNSNFILSSLSILSNIDYNWYIIVFSGFFMCVSRSLGSGRHVWSKSLSVWFDFVFPVPTCICRPKVSLFHFKQQFVGWRWCQFVGARWWAGRVSCPSHEVARPVSSGHSFCGLRDFVSGLVLMSQNHLKKEISSPV